MRICFVSAALPDIACGVGDYTSHLATALARQGVEPVVVTAARPGLRTDLPFEVGTFMTSWRFGEMPSIASAVLATRPDVVHIEFPGTGYGRGFGVTALPWAVLARRPSLATAITFHEFDALSRRFRCRLAAGALPCRLVVTPGGNLTAAVRRYLGWRPGLRVAEIPIASNLAPTNLAGSAPESPAATRHDSLRRRPGELIVGYWGFLRPDKGVETLIDAFAQIRETRPARLVIAGDPGPDEEHARYISGRVAAAGIADDVLRTGPLDGVALSEVIDAFDVCALPFRDGLAPNRGTYAGAVAHGVPVVTTRLAGPGEDAEARTRFVRPNDPAALARAILESTDAPRAPRIARNPSADWTEIARRHIDAYRSVLPR